MKRNGELKLATWRSGLNYQQIAERANQQLCEDSRLSETSICRIITGRRAADGAQARVLAKLLGQPLQSLFPESITAAACRCQQCNRWMAIKRDTPAFIKPDKQAKCLVCPACTRAALTTGAVKS